jgi:hypothetical protein
MERGGVYGYDGGKKMTRTAFNGGKISLSKKEFSKFENLII